VHFICRLNSIEVFAYLRYSFDWVLIYLWSIYLFGFIIFPLFMKYFWIFRNLWRYFKLNRHFTYLIFKYLIRRVWLYYNSVSIWSIACSFWRLNWSSEFGSIWYFCISIQYWRILFSAWVRCKYSSWRKKYEVLSLKKSKYFRCFLHIYWYFSNLMTVSYS
jgi:hypothetical protein